MAIVTMCPCSPWSGDTGLCHTQRQGPGQTRCNALVISSLLWRAFGQNNIWLTRNTRIKGEAVLVSIVAAVTDVLKERTKGLMSVSRYFYLYTVFVKVDTEAVGC